jgi:hypothetical protein
MPRPLDRTTTPNRELGHFTNRKKERTILGCLLEKPAGEPRRKGKWLVGIAVIR